MTRMAVLQHVEFEGPAAVANWAAGRGFALRVFHLRRDTTLPSLPDFDMLTVMGGPMSANDEARLGWFGPEIALVREAIAASKTVLGICLGAQIIAKALGTRVYPGNAKEIGCFPIERTGSHPFSTGYPIALHHSTAWRDIRPASRRNAARQEQDDGDSSFCSGSARARTPVSYGGDRGKRACAPERCCRRYRSRSFRAGARDDSCRPEPMRAPLPLARHRARPRDRIWGQTAITAN
jgi:GMP synthase-like glutamine amidotransferase